jgi:hypothetical protein
MIELVNIVVATIANVSKGGSALLDMLAAAAERPISGATNERMQCSFGATPVTFIIIALIVVCTGGAALALARGLFAFHQDAQRLRDGDQDALRINGLQQNRMMSQRVLFQGLAIAIVALLGALASSR